ncbi:MAG: monovalent cation/H(+) antiporter subunit G [Eubacteriales bacterium]|nr:monovalent cation/H(+) antiporter subunit G [Eubacteriales bacterium]
MSIAGIILVFCGIAFALFGMIGLFRFRHFYARILITSNIDAAGMLLLMIGVALQSPDAAFAVKVAVIGVLSLITSPLCSHAILRSARDSGYRIKPGEKI